MASLDKKSDCCSGIAPAEYVFAMPAGVSGPAMREPPGEVEEILIRAENGESLEPGRRDFTLKTGKGRESRSFSWSASRIRDKGKGRDAYVLEERISFRLHRSAVTAADTVPLNTSPERALYFLCPRRSWRWRKKGAQLGCTELLFVTGDKPELLYPEYREALGKLGYRSTAEYLIAMGEAGLEGAYIPSYQPRSRYKGRASAFRETNPSMGLMLENISPRLLKKGEAHHGCPDKVPRHRMKTMEIGRGAPDSMDFWDTRRYRRDVGGEDRLPLRL